MGLLVGVGAYCPWTEVLSALVALGFNEGEARAAQLSSSSVTRSIPDAQPSSDSLGLPPSWIAKDRAQLNALATQLDQQPQSRAVLFYSRLEWVLTKALQAQDTKNLTEVVEHWQQSLLALQELYRNHRSQVLLFELSEVVEQPQAFLDVCTTEWAQPSVAIDTGLTPHFEHHVLSAYIAEQLLTEQTELAQCLQYTQAMTWPLSTSKQEVGKVRAKQLWQFLNASKALLQKEKNRQQEELSVARAELEQKYQTLEQAHNALKKEQVTTLEQNQQLQAENTHLQQQESKQKTELTNALEENQLLLDQLFKVQEELEKQFIAAKEQSDKAEQLQAQNKRLAQENNNHHGEVDTIKKQFQRAQKELEQENKNLLKQLHVTQEELAQSSVLAEQSQVQPPTQEQTQVVPLLVAENNLPKGYFQRRAEKKSKRKAQRVAAERALVIARSGWFDAEWYLTQYPDVAADQKQAENPALHYMRNGGFEGRNPSARFNSAFYLEAYPDVAQSGINPLWHYLQKGQHEGRQPLP